MAAFCPFFSHFFTFFLGVKIEFYEKREEERNEEKPGKTRVWAEKNPDFARVYFNKLLTDRG
jgi:hypothetical protein